MCVRVEVGHHAGIGGVRLKRREPGADRWEGSRDVKRLVVEQRRAHALHERHKDNIRNAQLGTEEERSGFCE